MVGIEHAPGELSHFIFVLYLNLGYIDETFAPTGDTGRRKLLLPNGPADSSAG